MRLSQFRLPLLLASLAVALLAHGCGGGGGGGNEVRVVVTGAYSVDVGATLALTAATLNDEDASYTWSSADEAIATVDADGVVTGVAAGEVIISATGDDTGETGDHGVVVIDSSASGDPVVVVSGDFLVGVDGTVTLTAVTQNGTDASYTWSSADEAVATVDAAGVVTGVAAGEVVVTATGDDTGAAGDWGIVVSDDFDPGDIPNYDAWMGSGHADATAEAFRHWDEDDPAEVPTSCARCHSTPGFRDYIGDDGSAVGSVEAAVPVGTVISCEACHNATAIALDSVVFPSGVEVAGLGSGARCMTCHQGRESTVSVDQRITDAAVTDFDTVDEDLGFRNIHYYQAGATLNGGRVQGGYQYAGNVYDVRFRHAGGLDSCTDCHNPHTLEVNVSACGDCHAGVTTVEDTHDIRMMASLASDYDGDGDMSEGIHDEIEGLKPILLGAIQDYVAGLGLDDICYSSSSYPYWFIDADGDGTCSDTDTERYASWTARLVQATYNYQYSMKDPGGFAHNGKYVIQLLYDSVADLNTVLGTPVDLSAVDRGDHGHFDGSAEAFRHWDEDDYEVSSSCSKCHGGAEGFHFYQEYGVGGAGIEATNGMQCETCHDGMGTSGTDWTVITANDVLFPSDVELDLDTDMGANSNICGTCHSGRESKASVDARIASGSYSFRNIHYLPAASVFQGSAAQVGYEFTGMTYSGPDTHPPGTACTYCHNPVTTEHTFDVADNLSACTGCHSGIATPQDIRLTHMADYDGDASTTESLADELHGIADELLVEIQTYATSTVGTSICYNANAYPYWFEDTDGSGGTCDTTETTRYGDWDPSLMMTTFNYQMWVKEHGAWAHNFEYMAQLLIDSIEYLGGDVSTLTRP